MIVPRDYQDEAATAFCTYAQQGFKRQLIVLPTGTGKTIVFASLIARHRHLRTLVLAHREELIRQAVDKLYLVDSALDVGVVKAERNDVSAQVVVASVQTVCRKAHLEQLGRFGLIIVDEAHHAAAATYRYILSCLGVWFEDGPLLLGVTATPERSDYTSLNEVFQGIAYQKSILDMVEAGYLCDLRAQQVYVDMSLDGLDGSRKRQDFGDEALGAAMVQADAPSEIARAYIEFAAGRRGLCFAPNVETSKLIAAEMQACGVRAAHVDHTFASEERQAILDGLKRGDLDIVCNCGLLTEGFDEPSIDVIICARPTKFRGLYQQMIGRGTRLHPGKSECLILDVVGNTSRHDLQTLDRLYQLKPRQSILEALEEREQEAAAAPDPQDESPERSADHQLVAKEVDLFKGARAAWRQSAAGHWFINLGREAGTLVLRQTGQEGWEVRHMPADQRGKSQVVAAGVPFDYAYGMARDYLRQVPHWLVDQEASWRQQPASERQRAVLERLGQPVPEAMTKGDAFDRITSYFVDTHLKGLGWRDEAATARQLWRLRQLGQAVPEGLTKGEASDLLDAALAKPQQAAS